VWAVYSIQFVSRLAQFKMGGGPASGFRATGEEGKVGSAAFYSPLRAPSSHPSGSALQCEACFPGGRGPPPCEGRRRNPLQPPRPLRRPQLPRKTVTRIFCGTMFLENRPTRTSPLYTQTPPRMFLYGVLGWRRNPLQSPRPLRRPRSPQKIMLRCFVAPKPTLTPHL